MKTETPGSNDGALDRLLHEWKVETTLPARFDEQVWRRIALAEAPAKSPFAVLRNWIAQTIMRPSFALSYATILLFAGVLGGFWQANAVAQQAEETLRSRYVQMVDPYQMPRQ
jgi:hypothetical protein